MIAGERGIKESTLKSSNLKMITGKRGIKESTLKALT